MSASETLNKITKIRRGQADLIEFVGARDELLACRLSTCGSYLALREWIETGESRILSANFCKKTLLCPWCATRRSAKLNVAYNAKLESVLGLNPDVLPIMVTLTVKNGADLAERFLHLKSAWSKMLAARRRSKSDDGRWKLVEWNKVVGSLRAIEVTKSKSGEWHPHMHVFALASDYIDQKAFSREWEQWTGDSKIVGVTLCRGGIQAGLREVLKYACKFSSMGFEDVWHVHSTFKGHRLVDPQGILRGVPEPDIDQDDISDMSGPYRDFIARWLWDLRKFVIEEAAVIQLPPTPAHYRVWKGESRDSG